MVWPYDVKDKTYTSLIPVTSVNLNNIQDEINNIAGLHLKVVVDGVPEAHANWAIDAFTELGWVQSVATTAKLMLSIPAREGSVLQRVDIKYFQTTGSAAWDFQLREADINIATAAGAPTVTNISSATPAPAGAGSWNVLTLTGGSLPYTVSAEGRLYILATAPTIGDRVVGVRATFDQFY